MKKILAFMLAMMLCFSMLVSCNLPGGEQESEESEESVCGGKDDSFNFIDCEHNWERIDNLNESTARDKCTKCGMIRLYTDPDKVGETEKTNNLSMAALISLVETHGEDLAWEHFTPYYREQVGSGVIRFRFPIDDDYYLIINGIPMVGELENIVLVSADDPSKSIDVRYESIEDFISGYSDESEESEESVSGEKEPEESSSGAEDGETEKKPAIRMMKYNVFYCDISTKSIYAGELADAIIEGIEALEPTGETVEKISDEAVDQYSQDLPVAFETMWLEIGDNIYRIDPEGKIYLVESHLGAGVALETMSEELNVDINKAWFFYPRDYYMGTYYNETNEIELKNTYSTQHMIEVNVKDIEILSTSHHDEVNKITVELISTVDGTFDIDWRSEASSDNIGSMGDTCVELKAGEPQTVELTFCGWDDFYWLYIYVSNVVIDLKIIP